MKISPQVDRKLRVQNIAEPFPDLYFALLFNLLGNRRPLLLTEVFDQNDQLDVLGKSPSALLELFVRVVLKAVVELF